MGKIDDRRGTNHARGRGYVYFPKAIQGEKEDRRELH
jgi:hypothetical protein